jgi:hypothetical protein
LLNLRISSASSRPLLYYTQRAKDGACGGGALLQREQREQQEHYAEYRAGDPGLVERCSGEKGGE